MDGRLGIKEKENYDCYFLDCGTKRCKIYKVRPLQCRMFPFWPSMLSDKRVWDYYAAFLLYPRACTFERNESGDGARQYLRRSRI